jgi:hypothetical protein
MSDFDGFLNQVRRSDAWQIFVDEHVSFKQLISFNTFVLADSLATI